MCPGLLNSQQAGAGAEEAVVEGGGGGRWDSRETLGGRQKLRDGTSRRPLAELQASGAVSSVALFFMFYI